MDPPPAAGAMQLLQGRDGPVIAHAAHDGSVRSGNPATKPSCLAKAMPLNPEAMSRFIPPCSPIRAKDVPAGGRLGARGDLVKPVAMRCLSRRLGLSDLQNPGSVRPSSDRGTLLH
jgi:hypothetical protein